MLNCKLCDYYNTMSGGHAGTAGCDFTGILFFNDVEKLEMDYPCSKMNYVDYLNRTSEIESYSNKFVNEDWRYLYKKSHLKDASDRAARHAL